MKDLDHGLHRVPILQTTGVTGTDGPGSEVGSEVTRTPTRRTPGSRGLAQARVSVWYPSPVPPGMGGSGDQNRSTCHLSQEGVLRGVSGGTDGVWSLTSGVVRFPGVIGQESRFRVRVLWSIKLKMSFHTCQGSRRGVKSLLLCFRVSRPLDRCSTGSGPQTLG